MNLRRYLKVLSGISAVSIVVVGLTFFLTQNLSFSVVLSLIADSLQVAMYVVWLLQKEAPLENVPNQVETLYEYVTKKEERNRVKEELVSRLVNEGVVRDSELYTLIQNKEIILAFPYGEGIKPKVKELAGLKRQPLFMLLEKLGFVRVTRMQNLLVVFTENLPRNLRSVDNLSLLIKNELPKIWEEISTKVREKYPSERYKKYEKWRSGKGFGAMYVLSKSMPKDFVIDYVNNESFTQEFKKHIWGTIDRKKLRDTFKKRSHKVKEIVSKISIDFLIINLPRDARDAIQTHEDDIKKAFAIKVFTDYRLVDQSKMNDLLNSFLPDEEKANASKYSATIINESGECYNLLEEWGISFS